MRDNLGFLVSVLTRGLPLHVARHLHRRSRPVHVLFCMVDHYEPGTMQADPATERARVAELLSGYPLLVDGHKDADGCSPRRTWFFPPHDHRNGSLRALVSLCEHGHGEIELHLHHGKSTADTSENLARTIRLCLRDYSRFGIFGLEDGVRRYGFIHGDWALNNSLPGGRYCGVNDELSILHETGCYADFTFPSCLRSNPRRVNSIYYADIDLHRPKSYTTGVPARVGAGPQSGLLMIQGPARPVWVDGRPTFGDGISNSRPPSSRLLDAWVSARIQVIGKRDWVVVKTHCHGAVNGKAVLGEPMHRALGYLETVYNDGARYVLHYVTARELYNIVRAAEAGETGDPNEYRDYCVSPPAYDSSPDIAEATEELREAVYRTYVD